MSKSYMVMCVNMVGNPEAGYGDCWSGTGERHDTRELAIEEGFELGRSDDFNIGVIEGDRLVSIDWMHETVDYSEASLRKIAAVFGLS